MLYKRNTISRFCLATRKLHSSTLIFCPICKLRQEIVDLDSSPLSLPQSTCTTQSTWIFLVAATEQENVNAQIRNANSCPYASTNALSTQNPSCIMQQLYPFSVILVLEEFCYLSLEDQEAELQTVICQKVYSMLLYLFYIVQYILILIKCYFFQNPKLSIRIYRPLYYNLSLSFN
jgi:hypothetical protein